MDNGIRNPSETASLQGALSYAETLFIRNITAAELVCGQKRYKCSGCLHYYDYLDWFLAHIQQGRMEGFSYRLYCKMKSIQKQKYTKSIDPLSYKKMNLICMWMQTMQISAVPE
ncbi:hypothetical protein Q7C36_014281 [Tachysurus vachellii]|uniref:Uncharacterized protein n=1 Tax=Tachysurus vachellii TaxID=175792 RepID=A0AA88SG21_TACVA|nr:hypothetical protein Q7C36_014281 [Tachysurus vachellii]